MNSCAVSPHGIDLDFHSMSDEGLIAAAQSGQEWAFVELCARSSKRTFSSIYSVTRNREDAEDALQDSMLRAFKNLRQFDGRSSFATWFTRIGINSALMILRRKRVRPETSMDVTAEEESWRHWQISQHSTDPEKHYLVRERSRHLKWAIDQLPTSLRVVIEQGQMKGHSTKQIADHMGISVPAAKSRLARARAALRKSMSEGHRANYPPYRDQSTAAQSCLRWRNEL
jgi:RNA polymerase sigma factor (sigma-70 family)